MRHLLFADALAGMAIRSAVSSAGFASKAARKRVQQQQVFPFTKALAAFVERMTSSSVHPDAATGELNDKSLAKVLDFVKSLAKPSSAYPAAMAENITFVIRDQQSGKAHRVSTLLRTTGGDCSQAVGKSMASLFAGAGTPSLFYWDEGMWQLSNKPADEATVQDARAKAAAAGVPSSDPMTLQELEAVQARMDAKKAQASQSPGKLAQTPFTDASFRDLPGILQAFQPAGKLAQAPITDASFRDLPNMTHDAESAEAAQNLPSIGKDAETLELAQRDRFSDASRHEAATNDVAAGLTQRDSFSDASRHAATASELATSSGREGTQGIEPLAGLGREGPEAVAGFSPDEEAALQAQGVDLPALKAQIKKLAPLLAALAAVPWIDPALEDGQRVPFIKSTVLDEVEGMGWDVRGGVTRLWAGERNFAKLLADKDLGSRLALQAVIDLTSKFEQDFGKKPFQATS